MVLSKVHTECCQTVTWGVKGQVTTNHLLTLQERPSSVRNIWPCTTSVTLTHTSTESYTTYHTFLLPTAVVWALILFCTLVLSLLFLSPNTPNVTQLLSSYQSQTATLLLITSIRVQIDPFHHCWHLSGFWSPNMHTDIVRYIPYTKDWNYSWICYHLLKSMAPQM
jgi:hypothetical protein